MYGLLSLTTNSAFNLDFPFNDPDLTVRRSSSIREADQADRLQEGDFVLASKDMPPTIFVPARSEKLDAMLAGRIQHRSGLSYALKMLLLINSEPNSLRYQDIIYEKLYAAVPGHYIITINQSGLNNHIILLAKQMELNLWGVGEEESKMFLMWSDERTLEERMRKRYGDRFFYYRFPNLTSGSLVIQIQYVCSRVRRWRKEMRDMLKIFSALEANIFATHKV